VIGSLVIVQPAPLIEGKEGSVKLAVDFAEHRCNSFEAGSKLVRVAKPRMPGEIAQGDTYDPMRAGGANGNMPPSSSNTWAVA
jgi:hypothetical protein